MKPISITLTNIGPFVSSHTIDFTKLDNIYIIAGKTGSGKTTILDCITYALYGKLPGSRNSTDKRHLRSDYCSTQDISSIHFDFLLNGKKYRVERTLPFNKTSKRGTQTEESESAILYSIENNDTSLQQDFFSEDENKTIIESQKSRVDDAIENLLLLSIDEFTRIVLLPQGEFATFLKQNSKERKGLLIKLFPIEQFTRIAEVVKEERTKLEIQLKEVLVRVDQLKTSFDPESAQEEKHTAEKELRTLKKQVDTFQKTISTLLIEKNTLFELQKKFNEYTQIGEQLGLLQEKAEHIELLAKKITHSHDAEKIAPLAQNYTVLLHEIENNTKALEECNTQLEYFTREKSSLETEEKEHLIHIEQMSKIDIHLHDLQRCKELSSLIHSQQKEFDDIKDRLSNCKAEQQTIIDNTKVYTDILKEEKTIVQEYESIQQQQICLSHEILLCKNNSLSLLEAQAVDAYENAKMLLQDFVKQEEMQKLNNIAVGLAEHLEQGKECPVCGSLEHPKPVKIATDILNSAEKIRMQEKAVLHAEDLVQKYKKERYTLEGSIAETKKTLGDAKIKETIFSSNEEYDSYILQLNESLEEVKKCLTNHEHTLHTLKEASEKLLQYETIIKALQEKEQGILIQYAAIEAKIQENDKELHSVLEKTKTENTEIDQAIEKTKNDKTTLIQKTQSFEKRKKEHENAMIILTEKQTYIKSSLLTNKESKVSAFSDLCTSIQSSAFFEQTNLTLSEDAIPQYIEKIQSALMSQKERSKATEEVDSYYSEQVKLKALYEKLKTDIDGSESDTKEKLVSVQEKIESAEGKHEKAQNDYAKAQHRVIELESLLTDFTQTEKRKKEIEIQYDLYTKLHNVISGNNPKKTPLDSWILGMYLQEITVYANSRLMRMSNGRYQLHLKQDAEGGNAYKGLDLEIYDDYTGKARPTSTLSGGETFMTSISLALAISDMVQAQNGGIQLDSMFIDEGFGSLDPESLEKALGILDEIRETRSVALISHVEALQNRITSQVRVNKHISGSTIEIHTS